jgi:hypothetical protein
MLVNADENSGLLLIIHMFMGGDEYPEDNDGVIVNGICKNCVKENYEVSMRSIFDSRQKTNALMLKNGTYLAQLSILDHVWNY